VERWFPIETERLLLREFVRTDESDLHEFAADPVVSRYDVWGPNTREVSHGVVQRRLLEQKSWPRDDVTLAAELRHESKLIGSVRLWKIDQENRTVEIGYSFNSRYWNMGYGTESASALLDAAFRVLEMHRVIATCDTRNVGSWRVMEKVGMRREGHFVKDKFQKGEWRDSFRYAILADEWRLRIR